MSEQIRQKAKLFLNNVIRAKVKEYESLCKKYPEFSIERELPEGGIAKGGFLQDLEVWRYALLPSPDDTEKRTLIDVLMPDPDVITYQQTGTISDAYVTHTIQPNRGCVAPATGPHTTRDAAKEGGTNAH